MTEICFTGVDKSFGGRQVLRGVSFSLKPGGALRVAGASGCGKTTLARLLAGLEKPDGGCITGAKEAKTTAVFQEDRLCPQLSAVANVALVLPRAAWGQVRPGLLALGMFDGDVDKPADKLSGGQKRRVAICRAVLAQSDVLVLDEPFKGLDAENRCGAMGFIAENRRGRAVVYISHDADDGFLANAQTLQL